MKKLLIASVICSAIFLAFVVDPHAPSARFSVVFKVASIALLALCAAESHPAKKPLAVALAFSACGDLLLDIHKLGSFGPVQLFLFGLIAFLVAHVFYTALFLKARSVTINGVRTAAGTAVLVFAVGTMFVLWPGLAEMRIPVLAYSAVLTAMAITAQRSRFGKLVAIGALWFVASDTMLAMSIFGHPFAGSRILVWVTYYAAQLMITVGVMTASTSQGEVSRFASIGT